jgi:cytochrome bd ubiquinol oxidase subunit I
MPTGASLIMLAMTALDLARWQFGITTIFHFLFVPVSIGLALYVAICQTMYLRSGKKLHDRAAIFWGRLLLISFAVGVVTGIIQEFQFGMNWSLYSRYVGDVFGPPLAMEGLVAFFLESTFLGLWIFGRGRLSPKVHLATIWCVAVGTILSAYFIIAANAWMQDPEGYKVVDGKAKLVDVWKVLFSDLAVWAFLHVIFASILTAALVALAVSAWHLRRGNEVELFTSAAKIALVLATVGAIGALYVGDELGRTLVREQPMKMAAAEALFDTEQPAAFSLFATAAFTHNPQHTNRDLKIPHLLSLLATRSWSGAVPGVNPLDRQYRQRYGPGEYAPYVAVVYWSFRSMIYLWGLVLALTVSGLWLWRRGTLATSRRWLWACVAAGVLPFVMNTGGWLMTESGRQPWIVQGLLKTSDASSPNVSSAQVWTTIIGFVAIFSVLGGVAFWLFLREARHVPDEEEIAGTSSAAATLAY